MNKNRKDKSARNRLFISFTYCFLSLSTAVGDFSLHEKTCIEEYSEQVLRKEVLFSNLLSSFCNNYIFVYFFFKRSGRRRFVRSIAWSISHSLIFASLPDSNMSGTLHPLYSAGREYIGAESKSSWKQSDSALCSSPTTPGIILTTASVMIAAASSPPVST